MRVRPTGKSIDAMAPLIDGKQSSSRSAPVYHADIGSWDASPKNIMDQLVLLRASFPIHLQCGLANNGRISNVALTPKSQLLMV